MEDIYIQDAQLKIACKHYLKWLKILRTEWKAVSSAEITEEDQTALVLLTQFGCAECELRRTLYTEPKTEQLRVQFVVSGFVGKWQDEMFRAVLEGYPSWNDQSLKLCGEAPLYRFRLTRMGLVQLELGVTEKAWGVSPPPWGHLDFAEPSMSLSILKRESESSGKMADLTRAIDKIRSEISGITPAQDHQSSQTIVGTPDELLSSMAAILAAVGMKEYQKRYFEKFARDNNAPIDWPAGKGKKPRAFRSLLLKWWWEMQLRFEQRQNEEDGKNLSVTSGYNYAREGTSLPEIKGRVKKRRTRR